MLTGDDGDRPHSSGSGPRRGEGATPEDVLAFWFAPDNERRWFEADLAFDVEIAARFGAQVEMARAGHLAPWTGSASGSLALCLLLDQFPRNLWRGTPRAYSCDPAARAVAAAAIGAGHDLALPANRRIFLYMPFEHSEDLADQEQCVALMRALGDAEHLDWAERHYAVIARFGRFPHRNAILGRTSSEEEAWFLTQAGSSF